MFTWLNTQWTWIKNFFQEPDGKSSMKRLIMFWVSFAFLQSYIKISWELKTLTDIPSNWMLLIAGMIGLGIVDKYTTNSKNGVEPK